MELNVLWFILVTVLFIGFFFLEGFDYGVGIVLPFLGKNDTERRMIINTIGPVWDGNEVWMITAGGAMFAAFPNWYATLFSGFYLALFLMLVALIVRGVAFEFRGKDDRPQWRSCWDNAIFFGSFVPALLWGVAVSNIIQGVPIDGQMQYVGSFWTLLNPYALVGGVATLLIFTYHGALFLTLKLDDSDMVQRAHAIAQKVGLIAVVGFLVLVGLTYTNTDLFTKLGAAIALLGTGVVFLLSNWFLRSQQYGKAFIMSGLSIALYTISIFAGLFPRVMVSSLKPEWSLTIYNASSSPYTLKIMTFVALIMVPIVLIYQSYTYWVFRNRVSAKHLEY
jgi:cytochrome d ubiquinol oxidase subunit II